MNEFHLKRIGIGSINGAAAGMASAARRPAPHAAPRPGAQHRRRRRRRRQTGATIAQPAHRRHPQRLQEQRRNARPFAAIQETVAGRRRGIVAQIAQRHAARDAAPGRGQGSGAGQSGAGVGADGLRRRQVEARTADAGQAHHFRQQCRTHLPTGPARPFPNHSRSFTSQYLRLYCNYHILTVSFIVYYVYYVLFHYNISIFIAIILC